MCKVYLREAFYGEWSPEIHIVCWSEASDQ